MTQGDFRNFIKFATTMSTVKRALKVAFVVTPILTFLNHAQDIIALNLDAGFFFQMVLTFSVPYAVCTYSSAMTEMKNDETQGELNPYPEKP